MNKDNEQMLKEYKAEIGRHQQAIKDIMRKYNTDEVRNERGII